jgi:hypothetical protein
MKIRNLKMIDRRFKEETEEYNKDELEAIYK